MSKIDEIMGAVGRHGDDCILDILPALKDGDSYS